MFENLKRDLIFLDIEATGLHVIRDRIVQIAMLKYSPDWEEPQVFNKLVNPGLPISEEAMSVHGITPADVANKPTFPQIAKEVFDFIGGADLAGFNSNRFDIPMLMEELARAGLEMEMEHRRTIDVQRIFYKMEPRTLGAAYRYYCGEDFDKAHDALADVRATVDVLRGQIEMYKGKDYVSQDDQVEENPVKPDVDALHEFTTDLRTLDATQRLKVDMNGEVVFNFGKYLGKPVGKTLFEDKQYYQWMLNKEFSQQVKSLIRKILKDYESKVESS
jgi:DNA polymerase-3 subunit epsilon